MKNYNKFIPIAMLVGLCVIAVVINNRYSTPDDRRVVETRSCNGESCTNTSYERTTKDDGDYVSKKEVKRIKRNRNRHKNRDNR